MFSMSRCRPARPDLAELTAAAAATWLHAMCVRVYLSHSSSQVDEDDATPPCYDEASHFHAVSASDIL